MRLPHLDPVIQEVAHRRATYISEVDLLLLEHVGIGSREVDLGQEASSVLLLLISGCIDPEEGGLQGRTLLQGETHGCIKAQGERLLLLHGHCMG